MSEPSTWQSRTILLSCGDAGTRSLLEDALTRGAARADLRCVPSAAETLKSIDESRPGLAIVARQLPDADGTELTRRLLAVCPGLTVWIVDPGQGDAEAALESLRAGAMDYLTLDAATLAKLPSLAARAMAPADRGSRPAGVPPDPFRDLASIAHDLRSPLAGLVALFELLDGEADGPLTPSQKNRLVRIRASLERLTGVVDGISDLVQLEAGRISLSRGPVDLEEVLRAAKQALDPLLKSRSLGLQIVLPPDLPPLQGDSLRIRQMIVALMTGLSRQIEGTAVQLSASGRGSLINVTLREVSRGIPVEALSPTFGGMGEDDGGAPLDDPGACRGVSLTLARGLARLHGGTLTIERDATGGIAASFTLPASPAEAAPRVERPADLRPTT